MQHHKRGITWEECIPLVTLALRDENIFYRAWSWFLLNADAFVSEVTPRSFERGYAEWVKLSGPPDLRWK